MYSPKKVFIYSSTLKNLFVLGSLGLLVWLEKIINKPINFISIIKRPLFFIKFVFVVIQFH